MLENNWWELGEVFAWERWREVTGRVLGASGFLLVFWVAVSEKPVGPNSGYLYNVYNFYRV